MKIGYANVDPSVLGPMVNSGQYAAAYTTGLSMGYSPDDLANWLNITYGTAYTGASLDATMTPAAPPPAPTYPPTVVYNLDGEQGALDGSRYRWTHLWSGGDVLYDYATGQSLQGWYQTAGEALAARQMLTASLASNTTVGAGTTATEQHAIITSQLENPNALPSSVISTPAAQPLPGYTTRPIDDALLMIGKTKPGIDNTSPDSSAMLKLGLAALLLFS